LRENVVIAMDVADGGAGRWKCISAAAACVKSRVPRAIDKTSNKKDVYLMQVARGRYLGSPNKKTAFRRHRRPDYLCIRSRVSAALAITKHTQGKIFLSKYILFFLMKLEPLVLFNFLVQFTFFSYLCEL